MTIKEKMSAMLVDSGLWPNEATAVLDALAVDPEQQAMAHRWNDDAEGYPPQLHTALWMTVSRAAVAWIDANKPMHFARMMLTA